MFPCQSLLLHMISSAVPFVSFVADQHVGAPCIALSRGELRGRFEEIVQIVLQQTNLCL